MPRSSNKKSIQKYQFIHHVVPHPVHKTRATLLSIKAFFAYSAFLLVFSAGFKLVPRLLPGVLGYASDIEIQSLLSETNAVRASNGLPPLKLNSSLSEAAEKKAAHMFEENYWAHVSPSGVRPWDFILASGYDYSYAGENLAKNFNDSAQVVDAWNKSPSHKENLVNKDYDEIGFAVVNGVLEGYETTLVVQMFGKSRVAVGASASASNKDITPAISDLAIPNSDSAPVPNVNPLPEKVASQDPSESTKPTPPPFIVNPGRTVVSINLLDVSKIMLGFFIVFIMVLLLLDIWYSRKKSIPKLTGHTLAHLAFLLIVLGSVWLVLSPGRVL